MKAILLDMACLDQGLPPMSCSARDIAKMILSLEPKKKRKICRKIKKLCKRSCADRVKSFPVSERRALREKFEKELGFKQDSRLFNNRIFIKRIIHARSFIMKQATNNIA